MRLLRFGTWAWQRMVRSYERAFPPSPGGAPGRSLPLFWRFCWWATKRGFVQVWPSGGFYRDGVLWPDPRWWEWRERRRYMVERLRVIEQVKQGFEREAEVRALIQSLRPANRN